MEKGRNNKIAAMDISNKFRRLSFLAAVAVVAMHCTQMMGHYEAEPWSDFVRSIVTGPLTNWAVSFFFVVSGYWFGVKDVVEWKSFYLKKIRTVLAPYCLNALFIAILSLPIIMLLNHQTGDPITSRTFLSGNSFWGVLNGLFGVTVNPVNAGHLWYVRYLVVLFVMAPFWQIMKRRAAWLLLLLAVYLLIGLPMAITYDGRVGFFFVGIFLADNSLIKCKCKSRLMLLASVILFIVLSILHFIAEYPGVEFMLQTVTILLVWVSYDFMEFKSKPSPYTSLSFWVYCIHTTVLAYSIAVVHVLCGRSAIVTVCAIPAVTALSVMVSVALYQLGSRFAPLLMSLLTGGRGC